MPMGCRFSNCGWGGTTEVSAREAWRVFCAHWPDFDGTATGYWLRQEFTEVFGIDDAALTEERADEVYDAISERIAAPDFRPRALFDQIGREVLATTDDPFIGAPWWFLDAPDAMSVRTLGSPRT